MSSKQTHASTCPLGVADDQAGVDLSADQGGGKRRSGLGGCSIPARRHTVRNTSASMTGLCPLSRSDGTPPRRVAKLYIPPGAKHFGSREATNWPTWSSQERNIDRLAARKFRKNVMEVTF